MKVVGEFDYRNAGAILNSIHKGLVEEVVSILSTPTSDIFLAMESGPRKLSAQIARYFIPHGWLPERPVFTLPDLRYDLLKVNVPLEIEVGHQRLVYADFFKFLADYSQRMVPAGIMVVTGSPESYGHAWHNSLVSTRRKLEAVNAILLVPLLLVAVDP